jgi:hypothetical protein
MKNPTRDESGKVFAGTERKTQSIIHGKGCTVPVVWRRGLQPNLTNDRTIFKVKINTFSASSQKFSRLLNTFTIFF